MPVYLDCLSPLRSFLKESWWRINLKLVLHQAVSWPYGKLGTLLVSCLLNNLHTLSPQLNIARQQGSLSSRRSHNSLQKLKALDFSRPPGVILLQLLGHTTHRVQPLDRSFFGTLKGYYNQAVQKWLRTNPGLAVTQYQISGLVNEAYGKAATIENAVKGFKACGIWPVDRSVFKDSDFYPAENLLFDNSDEASTPIDMEQTVSTNGRKWCTKQWRARRTVRNYLADNP